jgi:hypothetical protein
LIAKAINPAQKKAATVVNQHEIFDKKMANAQNACLK